MEAGQTQMTEKKISKKKKEQLKDQQDKRYSERIYFHNGLSRVKKILIMNWEGAMNILFKQSKLGQAVLYQNI